MKTIDKSKPYEQILGSRDGYLQDGVLFDTEGREVKDVGKKYTPTPEELDKELEAQISELSQFITKELEKADKLRDLKIRHKEREAQDISDRDRYRVELGETIVQFGLGECTLNDVTGLKKKINEIDEKLPDYKIIYPALDNKEQSHRENARRMAVDVHDKRDLLDLGRAKLNFGKKLVAGSLEDNDIAWLRASRQRCEKTLMVETMIEKATRRAS